MTTFLPCFELVLTNFPGQSGHAYQEADAATNHLLAGVKFIDTIARKSEQNLRLDYNYEEHVEVRTKL